MTLGDLFKGKKKDSSSGTVSGFSHQTSSSNKSTAEQKGFVGSWVTTSTSMKGDSRAHVYNFTNETGQFNASMTNYLIKYGKFRKKDVQPVTWRADSKNTKIHTKLWDVKKTVFWGLTWTVEKYNKQTGELTVVQTVDGMKAKGSSLKLNRCGASSAKGRMFDKICPR